LSKRSSGVLTTPEETIFKLSESISTEIDSVHESRKKETKNIINFHLNPLFYNFTTMVIEI